uniref:Uncharacterized protein n=1 Tax=Arundo donax TaxID=35708 RepID=A0A0A9H5L3_ARUDO
MMISDSGMVVWSESANLLLVSLLIFTYLIRILPICTLVVFASCYSLRMLCFNSFAYAMLQFLCVCYASIPLRMAGYQVLQRERVSGTPASLHGQPFDRKIRG